jgi:hypothetical protein
MKSMSIVEFGEYKGNKLIILKRDENDKFPFSFGKGKARLIVENFDQIKKFVEEDQTPEG